MQTRNPLLDEFAQLMTSAMGAAQAMGDEAQSVVRSQMERFIADMDLAHREEIDVLRGEIETLRQEHQDLTERVVKLENRLSTEDV